MTNPYAVEPDGSVLEATTILSHFLLREGYSKNVIQDLAIGQFLEYERNSIKAEASMHLLAIKKSLLYSIPIIAPPKSTTGIELTSRVSCPAIQYDSKRSKSITTALTVNDKFRLIGFSFPNKLINHLSFDMYPWKYFNKTSIDFISPPHDFVFSSISLATVNGIETKKSTLFLINPKHYEDVNLFNKINKYIALALNPDLTPILATKPHIPYKKLNEIKRIIPFLNLTFIDKLNEVLPIQIDKTYTISLYEALQMSMNSPLYDQIHLIGFDST